MRAIKSWHRTFLMMAGVLAVLALMFGSTVAVQARIKCSCACKGSTRPYCAYHKCPCNPSSSARLQGVTLASAQGTVDLVLPPDIGAGDRISGTVFVEPGGDGQNRSAL